MNEWIEDVLASGVIGNEADGCRVRGAVRVYLFISKCFGICNIYNKLLPPEVQLQRIDVSK